MKNQIIAVICLIQIIGTAYPQDRESPIVSTTARIVGEIPDGTPAPAAPVVEFVIPAKDILETTTHELEDGRTVTINRIKPMDLPPAETTTPAPAVNHPPTPLPRLQRPRNFIVSLSAVVYRSASHPPRSFLTYRPNGNGEPITFWTSMDVSLLTGVSKFIATDGKEHSLFLMCHSVNTDDMDARRTQRGIPYQAPEIPNFPPGNATFQNVGTQPTAEDLIPIASLHELYNREFNKLLTAYQGREQARTEREAELKAHPPEPEDITINFWRSEKPAPTTEGGTQP